MLDWDVRQDGGVRLAEGWRVKCRMAPGVLPILKGRLAGLVLRIWDLIIHSVKILIFALLGLR